MHCLTDFRSYSKLTSGFYIYQIGLHCRLISVQRDNYFQTFPPPAHSHFRQVGFFRSICVPDFSIARQLDFIFLLILPTVKLCPSFITLYTLAAFIIMLFCKGLIHKSTSCCQSLNPFQQCLSRILFPVTAAAYDNKSSFKNGFICPHQCHGPQTPASTHYPSEGSEPSAPLLHV